MTSRRHPPCGPTPAVREENTKKSCDFGNGKTTARTWELREVDNPFPLLNSVTEYTFHAMMQLLAVAVAMMLQVVGGGGAAADRGAVLQAQRREAAAQLPPVHIFYYSWFGAPAFFDGSGSSFRGGGQ